MVTHQDEGNMQNKEKNRKNGGGGSPNLQDNRSAS